MPLTAIPRNGSAARLAPSDRLGSRRIPSPVATSVATTVRITPARSASAPHASFPAAPPANPTNHVAGTVEVSRYEPKKILLDAAAPTPSVLLLNDRYDSDWKVFVDGKPETALRCNYIMRGVYLAAGQHRVEFRFEPPATMFYISLASWIVGVGLCGYLSVSNRRAPAPEERDSPRHSGH